LKGRRDPKEYFEGVEDSIKLLRALMLENLFEMNFDNL
jgi:hypothetical protein